MLGNAHFGGYMLTEQFTGWETLTTLSTPATQIWALEDPLPGEGEIWNTVLMLEINIDSAKGVLIVSGGNIYFHEVHFSPKELNQIILPVNETGCSIWLVGSTQDVQQVYWKSIAAFTAAAHSEPSTKTRHNLIHRRGAH